MPRSIRVVIAASAALAALPAAASADTVDGTVVARDAQRGTVVTAARSGAVSTLRVKRVAAFRPGERVRGTAKPVGDGTLEAVRLKRRGRAGSARLNATVVSHAGREYVFTAGGSTFSVRAGRRVGAAGPGALVAARLKVVKGKVTAKKLRRTGQATTLELHGTFVDAAEGSLRVKVAGGALVTVLVPAGVEVWDEPGDDVVADRDRRPRRLVHARRRSRRRGRAGRRRGARGRRRLGGRGVLGRRGRVGGRRGLGRGGSRPRRITSGVCSTDRAHLEVRAGAGGNGALSFRREAHVPKGGPDGGDGGRGGDVVLRCDDSLRDLQAFRRRVHFRAGRGGHGQGSQRHGADGDVLIVGVPPGTQVRKWDGTRYDLVRPGQEVTIARGGAGGRGNTRFKSSTRQTPRLAERGLPGEEGRIDLHLKLLADVGLVGLPNAGKSSLLARLTRAHPKVAAYPFTTLEPVLGTLEGDDRQLVIADIPGLIEGAHDGAGLGHDFLAHVERTRLLVHVLDLAPLDGSDPIENHGVIEHELAEHDPRLAELPRILALSKADLVPEDDAFAAAGEWEKRLGVPVIVTSAATGQGLDVLGRELLRRVPIAEPVDEAAGEDDVAEFQVFRPAAGRAFEVEKVGDGEFRVTGAAVDRLIARHDLENEEALAHVEHRLRRMGVISALENKGFEPGDDVELGGVVFELDPS